MALTTAGKLILTMSILLALALALPQVPQSLSAAGSAGTIAYVRADTLDEIRLIEPNGTNDRRLWSHGRGDPENVFAIRNLVWNSQSTELAFASSHEFDCSINETDIYAIGANGGGYRRVTQAPACAELARFPQGAVVVPVHNSSGDSFTGFLYFQGAPGVQAINLPPGGSADITFPSVADFGDEVQIPMVLIPLEGGRELGFSAAVDVQAGSTVRARTLYLSGVGLPEWGGDWPTWNADGSELAYVFSFSSLYHIARSPAPLDQGALLVDHNATPDFVDNLAWGPGPSRANQILYAGNQAFDSEGIYLMTAGSGNGGEKLLSYEVYENILGLAWLPDGSGFVFSVIETEFYESVKANIFEYSFATKQVRRLTSFDDEYAGQLSVSPDGSKIVFERSAAQDGSAPTDLWLVNRDGSGLQLLARNAARPAWGRGTLQLQERMFLPLLRR